MPDVYVAGCGLVSSLGNNLQQACSRLREPPATQPRLLNGLEHAIQFHAIDDGATPSLSWSLRCASLLQQVAAEAGAYNTSGALYIASSSLNIGAIEAGEAHPPSAAGALKQLGDMLDWQGPAYWINTACTSGLNALLAASDAMLAGCIDEALVIGLELENRLTLAGFAGMQLLSEQASKPFAADRDGLVLGEAVAAIRLTREPARWRLAGGAQVIDSGQASGASTTAYQAMLTQALADAGLDQRDIDLFKVQAAGSIANDAVEAQALCAFFDVMPPLLTLKPLIGHTLGASGAAELALLLAMLEGGQWLGPGQATDPALGVTLAAQRPATVQHLLACILGFGGSHTCIALEDTFISHANQDV